MKKILSALFLVALIVGTVFILSGSKYYTNEGQILAPLYHITYAGTNDLDKEIRAELQRVDDALSMFNKQSVLSKFNRNEKYDVPMLVSTMLFVCRCNFLVKQTALLISRWLPLSTNGDLVSNIVRESTLPK